MRLQAILVASARGLETSFETELEGERQCRQVRHDWQAVLAPRSFGVDNPRLEHLCSEGVAQALGRRREENAPWVAALQTRLFHRPQSARRNLVWQAVAPDLAVDKEGRLVQLLILAEERSGAAPLLRAGAARRQRRASWAS